MKRVIQRLAVLCALGFGLHSAVGAPREAPTMRAVGEHETFKPLPPLPAVLAGGRVRAGRVTVVAAPGLEDTARELAADATSVLDTISADLIDDVRRPGDVEVRLVDDSSDLARVAPPGRGAPPWAIGVAYPDLGVISIAMRRGAHRADPMSTLRHELAHLALGAAIGDRAPHWLHEGFAYQHSAEWSWDRTETLAGMAWLGGIMSLDELDRTFPKEESPAHRAYAQSYDFVGYLSRRGRWEDTNDDGDRWPFRRFLAGIAHGKTLDEAAVKAFGRPLHELYEEWRANLSERYLIAPIGLIGLIAWMLTAVLLALAWRRRRRQNRIRLAMWDDDDRRRDQEEQLRRETQAAALRMVVVPPYVPWTGEDPLAEPEGDPDTDPERPMPPRLMN